MQTVQNREWYPCFWPHKRLTLFTLQHFPTFLPPFVRLHRMGPESKPHEQAGKEQRASFNYSWNPNPDKKKKSIKSKGMGTNQEWHGELMQERCNGEMKPGDTGSEQKREERQQKAHRLSTQGLINNRP